MFVHVLILPLFGDLFYRFLYAVLPYIIRLRSLESYRGGVAFIGEADIGLSDVSGERSARRIGQGHRVFNAALAPADLFPAARRHIPAASGREVEVSPLAPVSERRYGRIEDQDVFKADGLLRIGVDMILAVSLFQVQPARVIVEKLSVVRAGEGNENVGCRRIGRGNDRVGRKIKERGIS